MNNTVTGNCWCLIVTLPEGEHEYMVHNDEIFKILLPHWAGANAIYNRKARAVNFHRSQIE